MTLAKTGLGTIVECGTSATTTIYTVASSKTAYIRAILLHNTDGTDAQKADIHLVPNGGSKADANKIGSISLAAEDTAFFEVPFPIVLSTNGDTVQIHNNGSSDAINALVIGDKES